jgi:hypothetical protein
VDILCARATIYWHLSVQGTEAIDLLVVHIHRPSKIMLWSYLALTLGIAALASAKQTRLQFSQSEALLASPSDVPPAATLKELLYLHRHLIEIESITENEYEVGKWLASYLESKNFTVEMQEVSPKRFNLLAYTGKTSKTPILVSSHIDTVRAITVTLSRVGSISLPYSNSATYV